MARCAKRWEPFPFISNWYSSTPMGEITLTKIFNFSYGAMILIIVLLALIGFFVAEKIEARFHTLK